MQVEVEVELKGNQEDLTQVEQVEVEQVENQVLEHQERLTQVVEVEQVLED
jgi:hypothetical protein